MKPLKILLTACGCPGASTLIRMLKKNGERPVTIIGTDMDDEAIGRFFTDNFYEVPPGKSDEYISKMFDIVKKEKPDVLFPQSTYEVYPLAQHKKEFEKLGTTVIVSDPEAIEIANNKYKMYQILKENTNLTLPKYKLVKSLSEFLNAIEQIGYPEKPVIFKPPVGKEAEE